MKQKCNVSSFLTLVVLLVASHIGLAQSVQSAPTAQAQETFAEINQRLNEFADAKLANPFLSSAAADLGDSKSEIRWRVGLRAGPAQLNKASASRVVARRSLARLDLLRPIIEPELALAGLP